MIPASQVRRALALLGWSTPALAKRAQVAFGEAAMAQNDVNIRHMGGLQIGAIQSALEEGGIEFGPEGVRLRKAEP